MTPVVAAAQVNGKRNPGALQPFQTRVVRLDRLIERLIRVHPHFFFDVVPPLGIDVVAVARGIDLDVLDAVVNQRRDLSFHDRHDVPKKIRAGGVSLLAHPFLVNDRRELIGGRQSHLDIARTMHLQEIHFVFCKPFRLPDFFYYDSREGTQGHFSSAGVGFPRACDVGLVVEALHGIVEAAHESTPAEFAIGEYAEAGFLLSRQRPQDVPIFQGGQLFGGSFRIVAGIQQLLRTQQAADVIGAICHRHEFPAGEAWGGPSFFVACDFPG